MSTATKKVSNGKTLIKVTMGPREAAAVQRVLSNVGGSTHSAKLVSRVSAAMAGQGVSAGGAAALKSITVTPRVEFVS